MADDWFRNEDWNPGVSRRFEEKLRRARRKEQYLRIQACTLASTRPEVALELLDRYFSMPDNVQHAQAHVDRATALKTLGRIEEAADAYEAALAREVEFPNLKTQAYLELPILIAVGRLQSRFDRAMSVLDEQVDRLMFPVDHFLWHAARALIMASRGDRAGAVPHARSALQAASKDDSGFRYHPSVGLVTEEHRGLLEDIAALGAA
jgi:tetratricopeptide (TPR) repeat protein